MSKSQPHVNKVLIAASKELLSYGDSKVNLLASALFTGCATRAAAISYQETRMGLKIGK